MRKTIGRIMAAALIAAALLQVSASAGEAPQIIKQNGHYALHVDGKPFLMLGGQIHNSSAWPSELPQVWKSLAALNANTLEAPVYWEQIEPRPGQYDMTNVDALIQGARAHNLRVVLLWFGTWKNGNMHYVPTWVKEDTKRFERVIRPDSEPIDVLSPLGHNTLQADKAAFTALMKHLKDIDGDKHTVILVQVENESGNIGSVRDNSPAANALFNGPVPADILQITGKNAGTWKDVFGADADEIFQVYHQAKYINTIAAAGKATYNIPLSINVWLTYPISDLPQRRIDRPGIGYPSGGAVQKMLAVWKALAPAIDVIGPDLYSSDPRFIDNVMNTYRRDDNPLLIPEIARSDNYAKYFYKALNYGLIGFAPFGVDETGWNIMGDEKWESHARNFRTFAPMSREIAQLLSEGKVKAAIEDIGQTQQEIDFGEWQATVAFGFPQRDGALPPGTKDTHGAAMVAQLGKNEFLVTGMDASVIFHLKGKMPWMRSQFLRVEQGHYVKGVWKADRLLNGDETDRGICLQHDGDVVRVMLQKF